MISSGADVIEIERKCTINVVHFSHPETIYPSIHRKTVFHKTGPWCQKVWGPLFYGAGFVCVCVCVCVFKVLQQIHWVLLWGYIMDPQRKSRRKKHYGCKNITKTSQMLEYFFCLYLQTDPWKDPKGGPNSHYVTMLLISLVSIWLQFSFT